MENKKISTIKDLMDSLKNEGIENINSFLTPKHPPTIGNMYEGLTKEIMNKAIFKDLDLKVCSGFIYNAENKESKQIDCMIVVGEGKKIPYCQDYKYCIDQVIAVIEVKKNLFKKEIELAYKNLLSVTNTIKPDHDMNRDMVEQAYESVTGTKFPDQQKINKLTESEQQLYRALLVEAYMPVRIVFGYEGFSTEESLRIAYKKYLLEKTNVKEYGATSLPSLIIANENSIIKTNGLPFALSRTNQKPGEWIVLGSANREPMFFLLYLIWTRLYYLFPSLPEEIFDNIEIGINPFITAKARQKGWEYTFNDNIELKESKEEEWKPIEITLMSKELLIRIQQGESIKVDNIFMIQECKKNGEDYKKVIEDLSYKRIIYIDNKYINTFQKEYKIVKYNGKYYFGINFSNQMTEWCNLRKDVKSC